MSYCSFDRCSCWGCFIVIIVFVVLVYCAKRQYPYTNLEAVPSMKTSSENKKWYQTVNISHQMLTDWSSWLLLNLYSICCSENICHLLHSYFELNNWTRIIHHQHSCVFSHHASFHIFLINKGVLFWLNGFPEGVVMGSFNICFVLWGSLMILYNIFPKHRQLTELSK